MIRKATHADIPALVALGGRMHRESAFAPFDYCEEKLGRLIEALIDSTLGIAIVAEDEGGVCGGFLGAVHPHFFGADLQATDYALFLSPERRAGLTASRLIDEYVRQALAVGASQVMLATSTGIEPERVAALYESRGFERLGHVLQLAR